MAKAPASPQGEDTIAPPHPLAERLIERLHDGSRVLDFGSGGGRNGAALRRAGFAVVAVDDAAAASAQSLGDLAQRFEAVLCTHGLLHGTSSTIADRVRAICGLLDAGGLLYATFGSSRDARFRRGQRIAAQTYAPTDGDERGVPHTFFSRRQVRALLDRRFVIETLQEHSVDEIAGSWAHRERPLTAAVHWFAIARRR
jgi:SAM-dependent methyltransferase